MEAKCHTVLTDLTQLIIQLCVIFLVGIRITFLLFLEDTSAFGLDNGLLWFVWIFGNILIIAIDITLLLNLVKTTNLIKKVAKRSKLYKNLKPLSTKNG